MNKRIPTIMFPEVLDALEPLSNEEIGQMFRLIIRWNKGEVVEPESSLEKFAWATILPKLERDKENYEIKCEKARNAANKRWSKEKDTDVYERIQTDAPNANYNYNYNNNTSKEVLLSGDLDKGQLKSSEDDSVVSKGLERLESIFPERKNRIDIDTINLWNGFTQEEKQTLIQRATMYVRDEKKNQEGQYIKQLSKWLQEQKDKGLEPKKGKMTNSTKSTDPRLLTLTDGNIYSFILSKCGSTSTADKIYSAHNKKELYSTKEEMFKGVFDYFNNKN